jgi:hypothetical protein
VCGLVWPLGDQKNPVPQHRVRLFSLVPLVWALAAAVCTAVTANLLTGQCVYLLFAGGRGIVEDMCYERRRAEACVD